MILHLQPVARLSNLKSSRKRFKKGLFILLVKNRLFLGLLLTGLVKEWNQLLILITLNNGSTLIFSRLWRHDSFYVTLTKDWGGEQRSPFEWNDGLFNESVKEGGAPEEELQINAQPKSQWKRWRHDNTASSRSSGYKRYEVVSISKMTLLFRK